MPTLESALLSHDGSCSLPTDRLLTLPESPGAALSIRAKALVFHDPQSVALIEQVERIAATDATVLIIGETGTGKELIARHVHRESGRRGPFVAVNCGAFSENLIDAELFGHEAGAFTGASQARAGWFEAANNGTLFLDEIGDLPLALQVKLLRVLQERQVTRLGSRRPTEIDVRLVAATNVDLARAVEAGRFRRDLYYRLNIALLRLPRLAERPADILALAEHFIAVYGRRMDLRGVRLGADARRALLAHDWPGNIRELENVIHYALIVNRGDEIRADSLNLHAGPAQVGAQRGVVGPDAGAAEDDPLAQLRRNLEGLFQQDRPDVFATLEREIVQAAFHFCHRNQVRTSVLLGISRNVLRSQLKRFGLLPAQLSNQGP
ncbi:sigma-54 interaction domain-containing protein [Pseudaquabacterium terrae]|uniref:sigma-54 interaction domain-containing protein n=1 Tax=Pseudaquabacterium terrae TaxID=2732868 RepID=UPI003CCD905F